MTPTQLAMTGDDWTSAKERRRQARAEARLAKASLTAAAKMRAAAEALREQLEAYFAAGHEDKRGASDGRRVLIGDLCELASFFEGQHAPRSPA